MLLPRFRCCAYCAFQILIVELLGLTALHDVGIKHLDKNKHLRSPNVLELTNTMWALYREFILPLVTRSTV